jgi:hypothetical protein
MTGRLYDRRSWRRRSALQLQQHPLCEWCLKSGVVRAAQVVHHVERHRGDVNTFILSPLVSLCKEHHDADAQQIEQKGFSDRIGINGEPTDPRHPWNRNA